MSNTPNMDIPQQEAGSLTTDALFNEFAGIVDVWLNCVVLAVGQAAPTGSEVEGDRYVVGTGTGLFAGMDGKLAIRLGGTWQAYAPPPAGVPLIKNLGDGADWECDDAGVWSAKPSGGDVAGPASAVDLRIAVFDGTSGKDIKDGGKTIAELTTAAQTFPINAQTGTSYAILAGDRGKHLTLSNAASIAVTIAEAGTTGFEDGFFVFFEVLGAGAVTITPTTSTINGAATLVLNSGMSGILFSDGANYRVMLLDQSGITVNAQTGTSYTYLSGDRGKLVSHSNAAAIAATLPQATGAFGARWFAYVQNRGVGTVTITPSTSTIDGAASIALTTGQGVLIASDGTNYYTMRGMATGGGGGGGLTNFTEGVNTASPNATAPYVSFVPNNGATRVDVAIVPKSANGAFSLAVADGTTTGGNKRGTAAVDLQLVRANASYVASGAVSALIGGLDNTAGGASATNAGGNGNSVSASRAFNGGGQSNTVSGVVAANIGGANNTASANGAVTLGGSNNTASGLASVAHGTFANTRSIYNARSVGCAANNQILEIPLYAATTNATPTTLRSDSAAAAATNQYALPSNRAARVRVIVIARQSAGTGTGDVASWDFGVTLKNIAGTTSIVGTPSTAQSPDSDAGAAAWAVAVAANNTLDTLEITVTGEASKTIQWTAYVVGPES